MSRKWLFALSAALVFSLCACSAPFSQAEPTPYADDAFVPGMLTESEATPSPEPSDPLTEETETIENLLPGHVFRNMDEDALETVLNQFEGDFDGIGRTDDKGNSYVILFPAGEGTWPEDPLYYSVGQVSGPDDETYFEVTLINGETWKETEPLYHLYGLTALQFSPSWQYGYAMTECADREVLEAVLPHYRVLMQEAADRGLKSVQPQGAYLALTLQDEHLIEKCGRTEPSTLYLPLDEAQYQKAEQLIGAGFESKETGTLKKQYPDMYDTGVSLCIDGDSYALFSCWAFSLGSSEAYYPTLVSEALSDWVRTAAEGVLGYDPAGFSKSWFDEPLKSAELTFSVYKEVDGYGSWEARTQTVTDKESLNKLADLFRNAKFGARSGCPFTAPLIITREDGETLTIYVANDSCGTAMINGSVWCEYGEQADLAEIFGEAMATPD